MMILPLADALQNCLQDLTSRIAGIDNEQMAGRAMGMGAMLGYGIGAIKEQFSTPTGNAKSGPSNNNSSGGLQGFVTRAKSIINPTMNLTPEKDYNGNVNPIRNVIPNETNISRTNNINTKNISTENKSNNKSIVSKVAHAGYSGAKAYLSIGAKMAEGDFNKPQFKQSNNNRSKSIQYTDFVNNNMQKLGDKNEFEEPS